MKMKKNNQGFSLVELVIVVAIIIIIGGFALTGLAILSGKPVDECAKKIQVALEGNRNTTMGKLDASISFYQDGSGNIYVEEVFNNYTNNEEERIVKQIGEDVNVIYQDMSGNAYPLPDESHKLTMSFDRASGSLKPQADGTYVVQFVVSRGSSGESGYKQLTVNIDKLTGRVSVE